MFGQFWQQALGVRMFSLVTDHAFWTLIKYYSDLNEILPIIPMRLYRAIDSNESI